jgi:hypothetical protein
MAESEEHDLRTPGLHGVAKRRRQVPPVHGALRNTQTSGGKRQTVRIKPGPFAGGFDLCPEEVYLVA